jgi:predicted RNase H-like HicB family nuclease
MMELTAVLTPAEEGGYVALNPETGTTTQGETMEEAVANLQEATALYLTEFPLASRGRPVQINFDTLLADIFNWPCHHVQEAPLTA